MDISDILVIIGGFGLFYGLWLVYPPLAIIVIGFLLILLGLFKSQSEVLSKHTERFEQAKAEQEELKERFEQAKAEQEELKERF